MKKGFTLVELIAVIMIIAVLSIVAMTTFQGRINDQKVKLSEAMETILNSATDLYVSNDTRFKKREGNVYCITISDLVEQGHLTSPVLDPLSQEEISGDTFVQLSVKGGIYEYEYTKSCTENYDMLALSTETSFVGKELDKSRFESITTLDNIIIPTNAIEVWDASEQQNGSIKAWYTDKDNNGMYELYIGQNGGITARPDSSNLFSNFINVTEIDVSKLDTSSVKSMHTLFIGMSNLKELDLSNFDTSNVENMKSMFYGCQNLEKLDVSNFDTSNVINMYAMFFSLNKIRTLDVSSFDTSNVTNMEYMFYDCQSLEELDVSSFNTSNVIDMYSMFRNCQNIEELDLSSFDTSKVTDTSYMFSIMSALKTIYVSETTQFSVSSSNSMFIYCYRLVGGSGTKYDENYVDASYAHIDGGEENPGYFTLKSE